VPVVAVVIARHFILPRDMYRHHQTAAWHALALLELDSLALLKCDEKGFKRYNVLDYTKLAPADDDLY
jgi:hypothetical protein